MNDFVVNNNEIEYEDGADPDDEDNHDSTINHIRIRNQLNAELDELSSSDNDNENEEEKEMELIDNDEETPNGDNQVEDDETAKEQKLLKELTSSSTKSKSNDNDNKKSKRYFDLLNDGKHNGIMLDDDSDDSSSSSSSSDAEYVDSSDDDEEDGEDANEMNVDGEDEDENTRSDDSDIEDDEDPFSKLSKLEFEKLVSHTMVNLAWKLEENQNPNMTKMNNPFANMDDEIALETNNKQLNMKELLSFIDNDMFEDDSTKIDDENKDINDPKDFESIASFEKNNNILPEPKTSSANHPSNLRRSKLNNMTLSTSQNASKNTFVQEEERLAEKLSTFDPFSSPTKSETTVNVSVSDLFMMLYFLSIL